MLTLIDELEEAGGEAESLYLPSDLLLPEVENSLARLSGMETIPPGLAELAARSPTGAVFFWGSARKYVVLPPFPVTERYFAHGYDVEPLRSRLKHDFTVALVLIRLGAYAIGVCQGEKLLNSKVGTGLVHARHRQGGSSSARFRRHREKQIETFLTRVCDHAREQLEPHARMLDYITYGGARTTILLLQKRCTFLRQFDNHTLPPLLDIPEPRQAVLEEAVTRVWSSSVIEWHENETSA
ncbi:MAG: Vms1/Ankzf1 family peptidyl-tRNA hydrolase [Chloroflexota bacterium]